MRRSRPRGPKSQLSLESPNILDASSLPSGASASTYYPYATEGDVVGITEAPDEEFFAAALGHDDEDLESTASSANHTGLTGAKLADVDAIYGPARGPRGYAFDHSHRKRHPGKWRKPRLKNTAALPAAGGLTDPTWQQLQDPSGQVNNMVMLLKQVQAGGIESSLRPHVWPLLLGCISAEDSHEAQAAKERAAEVEYQRYLAMLSHPTSARQYYIDHGAVEEWEVTQKRILTDSTRTGRDGPLFQGEQRERTVKRLERVLLVYALVDPVVGYCQGMADLAAPVLHLYKKDYKVFWCFRHMMASVRANFLEGMLSMRSQMAELKAMLATIDPQLAKHLQRLGVGDFEVAFQMILLVFRRELSWEGTFNFWEMLWASEVLAEQPLRVHCAAALFYTHRRMILKFVELEELIQFVNGLPTPLSAKELCADAYHLHLHLVGEVTGPVCMCIC